MSRRPLWYGLIAWAVLAVVFVFADQPISDAVYNPESWWAEVLQAYGQLPGAFVGLLGGSLLLRTFEMTGSLKNTLGVIGLALATTFAALAFMLDAAGAQTGASLNLMVVAGGTLALLAGAQLLLKLIPRERLSELEPAAKVALTLLLVAGFATVWAIKIPWGRWTYRDILEAGDQSLFSPWYLPQGINGHHSFISGHTAFSFAVLPLAYLWASSPKKSNAVLVVALLWGVLGAVSRVVIGAHFASDTLFAAGLTITWFVFFSRRFGGTTTPLEVDDESLTVSETAAESDG